MILSGDRGQHLPVNSAAQFERPMSIAAADFDADGRQDLIVNNTTAKPVTDAHGKESGLRPSKSM
jgi:hypothetical protein